MEKTLYLVLLDTRGIQDYIFATNKLKEISGASQRLENLNLFGTLKLLTDRFGDGNFVKNGSIFKTTDQSILDHNLDWEVIYLGGGAGKILFKDKKAALEFCGNIKQLYHNETLSTSMATHIEKWQRDKGEKFKKALDRAERMMGIIKSFQTIPDFQFGGLYIQPCHLCGEMPASGPRGGPLESEVVCAACSMKPDNQIYDVHEVEGRKQIESLFKENAATELNCAEEKIVFPQELSQIGEQGLPNNYIAMLYADGNGMGKKLKNLLIGNEDNYGLYRQFSLHVDQASKEAIVEALVSSLDFPKTVDGKKLAPVSFILAGGDDLIVIMPAQHGADVALAYTDLFTKKFEDRITNDTSWPKDKKTLMTVSAGLALTKATYPIRHIVDRAHELLKSAKREFRKKDDPSAIDFAAIKSGSALSIFDFRNNSLKKILPDDKELRRFARPYLRNDFKKLVGHVRAFQESGFPRNKLQAFYEALFMEFWQSMLISCKLVTRLPQNSEIGGDSPKEVLIKFWHDEDLDFFPWRKTGHDIETPLSDLIELYEFIK